MNTPKTYRFPEVPKGKSWDMNRECAGDNETVVPIGNVRASALHLSESYVFYVNTDPLDFELNTIHCLGKDQVIEASKAVLVYYGVPFVSRGRKVPNGQ